MHKTFWYLHGAGGDLPVAPVSPDHPYVRTICDTHIDEPLRELSLNQLRVIQTFHPATPLSFESAPSDADAKWGAYILSLQTHGFRAFQYLEEGEKLPIFGPKTHNKLQIHSRRFSLT